MLQELSIKNFAIIDDLHVRFSDGLTILTGETGTGKSIIVNAVNLLLGSRATTKHIRTGSDTAELEALFQITQGSKIAAAMETQGYDPAEGLLIRRIISRKDKHSITINGHVATGQVLSTITENLASVSGQHAHQGLLKEDQHLLVLDRYGGLIPLRDRVYRTYHDLDPLIRNLKALRASQARQAEHTDLLEFQRTEILQAGLTPGEDAALEQERKRLRHGEALYQTMQDALGMLYSNPGAIVESLGEVKKHIDSAQSIDPALAEKAEIIAQATIDLEDVTEGLRTYIDTIEIDESRLEAIETRLFGLQKLKRKYGQSLEDVLSHLDTIDTDLAEIDTGANKIAETEAMISKLHDRLAKQSRELSEKRHKAASTLAGKVVRELSSLGMAQAEFQIQLEETRANDRTDPQLVAESLELTEYGIDRAAFLIAPNVGEALKPLAHIISGGELSRVVLALKAILAQTESVETIIFDEVDAGIGGRIAEVVGKKLSSLSIHYQTICITHLPQIAKFGNHHIQISKHVSRGRTVTVMKPLAEKERVAEIARMLGGETITPATLEHAREMLDRTD
ncbi:MAG: DNA repair protein RecN [Desulfobacterales bacterium]